MICYFFFFILVNVFSVCWFNKCLGLIVIVFLKWVIVLLIFLFFINNVKFKLYFVLIWFLLIVNICLSCVMVLLNIFNWYNIRLYWNWIFVFLFLFSFVVVIKYGNVSLNDFNWLNVILII